MELAKVKIHTSELLHKGVERERGVEKKSMDHVLYADSHLGPGERLIMHVKLNYVLISGYVVLA